MAGLTFDGHMAGARRRRAEDRSFRLVLWLAFSVLLVVAIAARLLPAARRPALLGGDGSGSVVRQAWQAATSSIAFAYR
jgi:hypothetical protein